MSQVSNKFSFTYNRLKNLPVTDTKTRYYDVKQESLVLVVTPSGKKTFVVYRKPKGAKSPVTVTIGNFPAIGIEDAREIAKESVLLLSKGKNPNALRKEDRKKRVTLSESLYLYLDQRGDKLSSSTANQYISAIENYSQDLLDLDLRIINRDLVEKKHADITNGRCCWKQKGGSRYEMKSGSAAQADLWARVFRAIYNFMRESLRDENGNALLPETPTTVLSAKRTWNNVNRKDSRIRNHELKSWFDAIDSVREKANSSGKKSTSAICDAIEVSMFTGLRKGEVFGLTWDRINFSEKYFWINETKNGLNLELPMTQTIHEIFMRRKSIVGNESQYVFPSDITNGPIKEVRKTIQKIVEETSKYGVNVDDFITHDARRTFISIANSLGISGYMLKRLTNHKVTKSWDVTEGYIIHSAEELRPFSELVERRILLEIGRVSTPEIKTIDNKLSELLNDISIEDKVKIMFMLESKDIKFKEE
ncbi:integrase family protein [Vibrio sp. JC009]|uniref:tyrosine-type recombinase/integrase n=1 Tax=Vibrio sp. JC009 TaxID=2912314 RepID=UPI0023AF9E3F|nr:integrase family protein [Vibrio sp. JC009]WED21488.1 integrase family protein [Vibrio sp. JC009]